MYKSTSLASWFLTAAVVVAIGYSLFDFVGHGVAASINQLTAVLR